MPTAPRFEKMDKLSPEQVVSVRKALEEVISSDTFTGSKRCQDFLRLVVDHALAGDLDALRERMIGVEMFGRPVDYDTSNDGVVRVRATEVRKRLAQYYAQAGRASVVRIEVPSGSYVPEFHWAKVENHVATPGPSVATVPLWRRTAAVGAVLFGLAVLVLVLSFVSRPKPATNAVRLSLGLPAGVRLQRNWHPFEHIALSLTGRHWLLRLPMNPVKALCGLDP